MGECKSGCYIYNSGILAAGENETNGDGLFTRQMASAVFLFDLTGIASYQTFVENNYQNAHLLQWGYVYPFENEIQDVLLYYASLPNTSPSVVTAIHNAYSASVSASNSDNLPAYMGHADQYRAWLSDNNYTWNSNKTKACQGNIFQNMLVYNLDVANATNYQNAAQGFLNYFHGVNPNSKVYMSNMSNYEADNSVTQFYHSWFENGSPQWDEVGVSTYGPPAGFIPGGPNPSYALDACCPGGCGSSTNNALCNTNVTPPFGQPIQKSYKDFNDSWPVNSWTVTEAGIYTNASYVRLVSKYVDGAGNCLINAVSENEDKSNVLVFPNPFSETVTVRCEDASGEMQIKIFDLNGKVVFSQVVDCRKNKTLSLNSSFLKSGFYVLEITTSYKTIRQNLSRNKTNCNSNPKPQ
ncbi:MAG: glycoside hydrolase family 9 protein [Bacteroidetes bacterium]|nr:glycoside hydrolase family 9 protein [Bacteroidota bacterium]